MKIIDMPEFRDKSEVLTFDESAKVCDAVEIMAQKNYGAVLATKNGKLSGVFTERDLLRRIAACELDLKGLKLKDVMTKNVKTASVNDSVTDCMRRMSQGRFRHLPIVNDKGKVIGMLSQGDFVAFTMGDLITRIGTTAKAGIEEGRSTPIAIIAAILTYTIGLIVLVAIMTN